MYGKSTAYRQTEVETADRGRLLLLVYDHCIKWCGLAREAIRDGSVSRRTKAILKVQDGITELLCSLDFERGGEIAKNLRNLYNFYNKHLTEANLQNSEKHVEQVQTMLETLRTAWSQAILNVRRTQDMDMRTSGQRSMISLVG